MGIIVVVAMPSRSGWRSRPQHDAAPGNLIVAWVEKSSRLVMVSSMDDDEPIADVDRMLSDAGMGSSRAGVDVFSRWAGCRRA